MLKGRFVTLALMLLACQATAATIQVGNVKMQLPTPAGFVQVTPQMTKVAAMAEATRNPRNIQPAYFIPKDKRQVALAGELPLFLRHLAVQSDKHYINTDVSLEEFDGLKQAIRKSNQSIMKKALAEVNRYYSAEGKKKVDHIVPGAGLKFNGIQVLPIHAEGPRSIAYSLLGTVHADLNGKDNAQFVFACTVTLMLVKKRILFLYVYGTQKDLGWTRAEAARWTRKVLAANGEAATH